MIIYCDISGNVSTVPSSIPFGSALREIVIIAPQITATAVLKLKPPSQEYLPDIICSPALDAEGLVVFNAKLPKAVANRAGRVEYQLHFVTDDGESIPSYAGSFNILRGVMVDMPDNAEELSEYSLEQLYTMLTNVTKLYNNVSQIEDTIGIGEELETVAKTVIGAINEVRKIRSVGIGIEKIEKTSTSGLVDTYTIYYTNNDTSTYTVTNGAQGQQGPKGEKGKSSVYVGSDTPPDDADVWIDGDGVLKYKDPTTGEWKPIANGSVNFTVYDGEVVIE